MTIHRQEQLLHIYPNRCVDSGLFGQDASCKLYSAQYDLQRNAELYSRMLK